MSRLGGAIAASRRRTPPAPAVWQNPPPITATDARNRATQVVNNAVHTAGYNNTSPANATNFDFTGSTFESIGYCDYDSFYDTADCVSECGTAHGTEDKPIRIATAAAAGTATSILGGKAKGDQPTTLTWGEMKHGRTVQDDWDLGGTSGSSPTADANAYALGVQNGSYIYVDGARIYSTMDGININSGDNGSAASHGICYVKNSYIERARDTAFTSEGGHLFRVFDTLIKDTYGFADIRNNPSDMSTEDHIFEYVLARLQRLPGGFRKTRSQTTHDKVWKSDAGSPRLVMEHCIIAIEDADENPNFPAGGLYTDVTVLWLRNGVACPWTGEIRTGMTLVNADGSDYTNALAQWDAAEADWKTRHGLTSYDVAAADDMIDAQAPAA